MNTLDASLWRQPTPENGVTFVYPEMGRGFLGPWATEIDLDQPLQWLVRGKSGTFGRTALRFRRFPCGSYTFGGLPGKACALQDAPGPNRIAK